MLGRKFEVHTSHPAFAGFVLDTQVGYRNLIANNLKAVTGGNLSAGLSVELREVAVELPLQLEIEDDTEIPATSVEDSPGLFLVQAIKVCVVVRLLRLNEAVIGGLTIGKEPFEQTKRCPFLVSVSTSRAEPSGLSKVA